MLNRKVSHFNTILMQTYIILFVTVNPELCSNNIFI